MQNTVKYLISLAFLAATQLAAGSAWGQPAAQSRPASEPRPSESAAPADDANAETREAERGANAETREAERGANAETREAERGANADAREPAASSARLQVSSADAGGEAASQDEQDDAYVKAISEIDIEDLAGLELEGLLSGDVVISVSHTAQKIQEAPAAIHTITRQQILQWGYRSVADVLRHRPGFYVIDDHRVPNVAVRGLSPGLTGDSGLIKVMIDGREIAYRPTAGNWLGPETIPLSAVERIEIIKGPVSSLYGADAFMGVINIITRKGADLNGGQLFANSNVSDPGAVGGGVDLTVGNRVGPFEALLSLRFHREDRSGLRLPQSSPSPRIPTYNAGNDTTTRGQLDSGTSLAKLTWHVNDAASLTVTGQGSLIARDAEFGRVAQLTAGLDAVGRMRNTRVSLARGVVDANFQWDINDDLQLTLRSHSFAGGPTDADRIEINSATLFVEREQDYRGFGFEGRLSWKLPRSVTLVAGADYMLDNEQKASILTRSLRTRDVREATSLRNDRINISNVGAYLHGVWDPRVCDPERPANAFCLDVNAVAGARFDRHSIYGNQYSGRLGLVVAPFKDLVGKILWGSAFKAPSPLLLFGSPAAPGDIVGNPDLAPQYVHTVEGHLSGSLLNDLSLATGVAYSFITARAAFGLQQGNWVAENIAEEATVSWESEVRWEPSDRWRVYANYTWTDGARNPGDPRRYQARLIGPEPVVFPGHMVNLGGWARLPGVPLAASVEGRYISPRRASPNNILLADSSYELAPGFFLDATLQTTEFEFLSGLPSRLQVVARNILGEDAPAPGFAGVDFPARPRFVMLQLIQSI